MKQVIKYAILLLPIVTASYAYAAPQASATANLTVTNPMNISITAGKPVTIVGGTQPAKTLLGSFSINNPNKESINVSVNFNKSSWKGEGIAFAKSDGSLPIYVEAQNFNGLWTFNKSEGAYISNGGISPGSSLWLFMVTTTQQDLVAGDYTLTATAVVLTK